MKLMTWNINSARARADRLVALLAKHQPDVVCLQETKCSDDLFPLDVVREAGYEAALHGQRTYNGVAILARAPLADVERGFPGDPVPEQARVIGATVGGVRVVSLYVVNGKAVGTEPYALKLRWLEAFEAWLRRRHTPGEALILAGDFNIAPDERDVHDPVRWSGRALASEPERERLRRLIGFGLQDLLRLRNDEPGFHTWWDYRAGAFHRGWGLRIDLVLGTELIARRCRSVEVDREARKKLGAPGSPSDHAPVLVTLD